MVVLIDPGTTTVGIAVHLETEVCKQSESPFYARATDAAEARYPHLACIDQPVAHR